jgi:hypothetical protein
MYEIAYGSKYERDLDVAEIARRLRQEIKDAIAAGTLPRMTVSVRLARFAGGQSIDIKIKRASFPVLNRERVLAEQHEPGRFLAPSHYPMYTDQAQTVLKQLQAIHQAYNYDGSEIQVDYYNVNYYGQVEYAYQLRDAERDQILAEDRR